MSSDDKAMIAMVQGLPVDCSSMRGREFGRNTARALAITRRCKFVLEESWGPSFLNF